MVQRLEGHSEDLSFAQSEMGATESSEQGRDVT